MLVPGEEELGAQKRCTKCGSWWPLDDEFWYRNHGAWHPWCRACHREARTMRWDAKVNARSVR